jgi:hypothetical protein
MTSKTRRVLQYPCFAKYMQSRTTTSATPSDRLVISNLLGTDGCNDNWPDCMYFAKQGYCKTRRVFDVICCESCKVLTNSRKEEDTTTKWEAKSPSTTKQLLHASCYQPAESGACFAYIPQWHYDAKTNKCKEFIYGGCQGNQNRFGTEKKCFDKCGYVHTTIAAIRI